MRSKRARSTRNYRRASNLASSKQSAYMSALATVLGPLFLRYNSQGWLQHEICVWIVDTRNPPVRRNQPFQSSSNIAVALTSIVSRTRACNPASAICGPLCVPIRLGLEKHSKSALETHVVLKHRKKLTQSRPRDFHLSFDCGSHSASHDSGEVPTISESRNLDPVDH